MNVSNGKKMLTQDTAASDLITVIQNKWIRLRVFNCTSGLGPCPTCALCMPPQTIMATKVVIKRKSIGDVVLLHATENNVLVLEE